MKGNFGLDIAASITRNDGLSLEALVDKILRDSVMIAEVGSWKGMSATIFAQRVATSNGRVFCIDHWRGSPGSIEVRPAMRRDILATFRFNIQILGFQDVIHPFVVDSLTATRVFANELFDLVFIDADHRYESVKRDILAWLPKVRKGGILCGHDCECQYSRLPKAARGGVDKNLDKDYVFLGGYHPGVIKALYDIFNDEYNLLRDTIWCVERK